MISTNKDGGFDNSQKEVTDVHHDGTISIMKNAHINGLKSLVI